MLIELSKKSQMFRAKGSKLLKYPRVEQTETLDERL